MKFKEYLRFCDRCEKYFKTTKKYYDKSRINLLFFYWELGKRVNQEYGKPLLDSTDSSRKSTHHTKLEDSITSIVERLREEGIAITRWNLCQARRFAVEYDDINELIEESDISWSKIRKTMSEKFKEKKEQKELMKKQEELLKE